MSRQVEHKQQLQKSAHDNHAVSKFFMEGEEVYARNFRHDPPWVAGKIIKVTGPRIQLRDRQVVHHHQDHIQKHKDTNASLFESSTFIG